MGKEIKQGGDVNGAVAEVENKSAEVTPGTLLLPTASLRGGTLHLPQDSLRGKPMEASDDQAGGEK